jgi:signal transduction histidine kinase
MNSLFKKLSLPYKLGLIATVPLLVLVFLCFQVYRERSEKIDLLESYVQRMQYSQNITALIYSLQEERRYSFEFTLNKTMHPKILSERLVTDSILERLSHYDEPLSAFESYTFLDHLADARRAIDSSRVNSGNVMDYYTNSIFRLNTLNALPTGSYVYLKSIYKDLVAQKILSEIITYFGIMQGNIYNILYTKQYIPQILLGTVGVYNVYKSYKTELKVKAPPEVIDSLNKIYKTTPLGKIERYIDTLFKRFTIDSTYNHDTWRADAEAGIGAVRQLQIEISKNTASQIENAFQKGKNARDRTLLFLIATLIVVAVLVVFTIYTITRTLKEIETAARQISLGVPGLPFNNMPDDMIGDLAKSIAAIDENHIRLAAAAHMIGQGQFQAQVNPRSENDLLGNALVEMKANLQQSTSELKTSNAELERFAYVASHDLQEPLRMVSSFLHLLERKLEGQLDDTTKQYIGFAVDGAERMKVLIQDLLEYSRVGTSRLTITKLDCNEVLKTVLTLLSVSVDEKKAAITLHPLPVIQAVEPQMIQLFQNLIGNALKYNDKEIPEIEIGYTEKEMYEFYVRDNGIGIDPRFSERIFVIFQRLHNKSEYSGTGIGLSICRKIVEKHGGRIWVSAEPGKGSTFYFTLPKQL